MIWGFVTSVRGHHARHNGGGTLDASCQLLPRLRLPHPDLVVRSLLTAAATAAKTWLHHNSQRRQQMKVRSSVIALGAAALLGGTGAIAVPALASSQVASHTLKFTSVIEKSIKLGQSAGGQEDRDFNASGKVIGFDELYMSFDLSTGVGTGNVAVVTKGGILYGKLKVTQTSISGKVTGGTGKFAGARGTISAHNLNPKGTRTAVTIRYHG